jgi:hypothetical protein
MKVYVRIGERDNALKPYFVRMSVDLRMTGKCGWRGRAVVFPLGSAVPGTMNEGSGLCGFVEWLLLMWGEGWPRDRVVRPLVNMIDTHLLKHPDQQDAEQDGSDKGFVCHQHRCPPYAVTHEV